MENGIGLSTLSASLCIDKNHVLFTLETLICLRSMEMCTRLTTLGCTRDAGYARGHRERVEWDGNPYHAER